MAPERRIMNMTRIVWPASVCLAGFGPATGPIQKLLLCPLVRASAFWPRWCGIDEPAAFAEADPDKSVALGARSEDHLIAILEPSPGLAVGQTKRLGAADRELTDASPALICRARDSAAAEQVARLEIAAVAGVMR